VRVIATWLWAAVICWLAVIGLFCLVNDLLR
jgi:membrane-associated PAP2 superfamily phosphatase